MVAPQLVEVQPSGPGSPWCPGLLLGWRWVDQEAGTWRGHVRYELEGLNYEHWVDGAWIRRAPDA